MQPTTQSTSTIRSPEHLVCTIVVGGGSGQRFGSLKQFQSMCAPAAVNDNDHRMDSGSDDGGADANDHDNDRANESDGRNPVVGDRVIDRSVAVAAAVSDHVVVVVPVDHVDAEAEHFGHRYGDRVSVVAGGASRSESVRSGLSATPDQTDIVCVHDAARPLATPALYRRVIAAVVAGADGVVPAIAVTDTIKVIDDDGWVTDTPSRDHLVAVQTPQAFPADLLRRAHSDAPDGSDDAVLVEAIGSRVRTVEGELDNIKITHPDDLARLTAFGSSQLHERDSS